MLFLQIACHSYGFIPSSYKFKHSIYKKMNWIKKTVLYILGLILLLFGNKKALEAITETLMPTKPEDVNSRIEDRFEVQKLIFDKDKQKLTNPAPYFEVIRVDETRSQKVRKETLNTQPVTNKKTDKSVVQPGSGLPITTLEPDDAEIATATQ